MRERDVLVLGIDPGTAITGYGLVSGEGDALHLLTYGVVTTFASERLPARLQAIHRELSRIIETYHPDEGAVEELFFSRNVRTALAVGQARGVALLALTNAALPIFEYTPLQVKQAITGYGRADKNQMQEMVRLLLRLESVPQPDDAADAIAIAICHLHSRRLQSLLVAQSAGLR